MDLQVRQRNRENHETITDSFSMKQSDFFQLWMALFLLGMVAQSQTTLIGCTTTTVKEAMEILPV